MAGLAIVLGGADCLWDDVAALREMIDVDAQVIVAVNDAGFHWPGRLDHWCTRHPSEFTWRAALRHHRGREGGYTVWSPDERAYEDPHAADHQQVTEPREGSSAFLAAWVAWRRLGLSSVLCGVPMGPGQHLGRKPDRPWDAWRGYRGAWERASAGWLGQHVRSMSGWTRELVGAPTQEWLEERGAFQLAGRTI